MAISQNFLTGRMRKSAGGTRFSTWRGLNIVASKPMEVRQNVTPAVQLNRDKMAVIGKMVSKLNTIVNDMYSLGIAKTTPFADTVKFFRNRILDSLKLDAVSLNGAQFGTGNVPSGSYICVTPDSSSFECEAENEASIFGSSDIIRTIIVVNDLATKVGIFDYEGAINAQFSIDLTTAGFGPGDKIAFAVRPRLSQPGADLSGKVKFAATSSFYTLS